MLRAQRVAHYRPRSTSRKPRANHAEVVLDTGSGPHRQRRRGPAARTIPGTATRTHDAVPRSRAPTGSVIPGTRAPRAAQAISIRESPPSFFSIDVSRIEDRGWPPPPLFLHLNGPRIVRSPAPPHTPRPPPEPINPSRSATTGAPPRPVMTPALVAPIMPAMPAAMPSESAPGVHITYTGGTIGMIDSPHGLVPSAELGERLFAHFKGTDLDGRISLTVLDPLIDSANATRRRARRAPRAGRAQRMGKTRGEQRGGGARKARGLQGDTSFFMAPTRWPTPRPRCPTP